MILPAADFLRSLKYRPHIVVGDRKQRVQRKKVILDPQTIYECDGEHLGVVFSDVDREPKEGEEIIAELGFTDYPQVTYRDAVPGATFTLREGARIVGFGEILEVGEKEVRRANQAPEPAAPRRPWSILNVGQRKNMAANPIPKRLTALIEEGFGPRDGNSVLQQNLGSLISESTVRNFAPEESMIFLFLSAVFDGARAFDRKRAALLVRSALSRLLKSTPTGRSRLAISVWVRMLPSRSTTVKMLKTHA